MNDLGKQPAFPLSYNVEHKGMNIRTYLAGKALNGMLAHATRYKPLPNYPQDWHDAIGQEAVELADSLIKQLEKENNK